LKVDLFIDSRPGENVVTSTRSLCEAERDQKIPQLVETDICV